MRHYECGFLLALLFVREVQNDYRGSLKRTLEESAKGDLCGEHAARVPISFLSSGGGSNLKRLRELSQRQIFQSVAFFYPSGIFGFLYAQVLLIHYLNEQRPSLAMRAMVVL